MSEHFNYLTNPEAMKIMQETRYRIQQQDAGGNWHDTPCDLAIDDSTYFRWHPEEVVTVIVMTLDEPSDRMGIIFPACLMPDPRMFDEWAGAEKDDSLCFTWSTRTGDELNRMQEFEGW